MKKVIFALMFILSNLAIVNAESCDEFIKDGYEETLNRFTYSIESANHLDMNGEEESGYIKFNIQNLSSDIELNIIAENGVYSSKVSNTFDLKGGVYELLFYVDECTVPIKKYEIKVPYYKLYCDLDKECEDTWFDGTYENLNIETEDNDERIIDRKLLIVLVSLVLIVIIIALVIKRQRRSVVK